MVRGKHGLLQDFVTLVSHGNIAMIPELSPQKLGPSAKAVMCSSCREEQGIELQSRNGLFWSLLLSLNPATEFPHLLH